MDNPYIGHKMENTGRTESIFSQLHGKKAGISYGFEEILVEWLFIFYLFGEKIHP